MICENVASPCINSARPGACGSTDTAEIVGDDAAEIDHHDPRLARHQAGQRQRRQRDAFTRRGAEHRDLARGLAGTAQFVGESLDLGQLRCDCRDGFRSRTGSARRRIPPAPAPAARIDAAGETNAATARGAVMRNNSPVTIMPVESNSVASVAISTIGSFFG